MSAPRAHRWLQGLSPYKPGLSKAAGVDEPVKLSANESSFGPSPAALDAYAAASASLSRYPDGGAKYLRQALARLHNLKADQIVCGAGSDEILLLLVQAFSGVGDEIIHSSYGFSYFPLMAKGVGASPIAVMNNDWAACVNGILAAVTPKTKLIFLDNPNNPTGAYLPFTEVKRLHAGLREDIILVLDGAYAEAVSAGDYDAGSVLVEAFDNVVMTRTFSKLYALAGLRVGWGYMPPAIADILNRIKSPFNLSGPAEAAAIAAVGDQEHLNAAKAFNAAERETISAALTSMGLSVVPSQTNFVLIEFPSGENENAEAANAYLMKNGYLLRWLPEQGLENHLRMTVGAKQDNRAILMLLREFLSGIEIK